MNFRKQAKRTTIKHDFSRVKDDGRKFANGEWSIQRSKEWLSEYKEKIEKEIGNLGYTPWTYVWFRCLYDGGHALYGEATRALCVCPKCYKEWGQPYYANNCCI